MFSVSQSLKDAVQFKNAAAARDAVIAYINADPDDLNGDAARAAQYAVEQGVELWESHDSGISMDTVPEHWDINYAAHVTTTLYRNFSKERFAHWQAVAEGVRRKRQAERNQAPKSNAQFKPNVESKQRESQNPSDDMARKILIGAAVAAAVIVVAAVVVTIK